MTAICEDAGKHDAVDDLVFSQENAPGIHPTCARLPQRPELVVHQSVTRITRNDLKLKCLKEK